MSRIALVLATSTGGVGRHVHQLCGPDVLVCGPAATEELFRFTATGARFVAVEDVRDVLTLRKALRGSDLVHAHGFRAGGMAGLAKPRRTPLVVTWHNAVQVPPPLGRLVARRADVTLAVSPDLVEVVRRYGGRDVRLVPVGAPPLPPPSRDRAAVRAELGAGSRPVVLAIGRLHPQKGFDVLAAAATGWDALTVIAGDGPARSELEQHPQLTLLGRRDDIADLLAAADVVVMPSRWEGSPLAAHEALQAGRPLVATAVGGLPGLLGDAAVLVPPEDPAALREAVQALLDDPARAGALAARGRERAAAWPDAVAEVRRIWAELL